MSGTPPKLLSVVVPCFNEEEVIVETNKRLTQELEKICETFSLRWEILYVDDGSRDRTLEILWHICNNQKSNLGQVYTIALAKNFGHQIAITAGMSEARGDAVVTIDSDLQDPPAVIREMVDQWLNHNVDVSYGQRLKREGETWFKLTTANLFYKLMRHFTNIDIPVDTGDFRLMSRDVVDVFLAMPERHRFVRGMVPWIGFKQAPVMYQRDKRFAGTTKYPLSKMIKLAFDALTSFSMVPLRFIYFVGFLCALVCFIYGAEIIIEKMVFNRFVPGWSSLMVVVLFLSAVQLFILGILGEYIGRIFDQVKMRPMFVINKKASRLSQK